MNDVTKLVSAIELANAAAEKLLRCAESISNPVYSVVTQSGKNCEVLAVRHFQGQIVLTVADVNAIDPHQRDRLSAPRPAIEHRGDDSWIPETI